MAKSPSERINELLPVVATLDIRIGHCDQQLTVLLQEHKEKSQSVSDRCTQYELELSHLKRDVDELKRWKAMLEEEQNEQKKWHRSFRGPTIAAAFLTIFLAPLSVQAWSWISSHLQRTP